VRRGSLGVAAVLFAAVLAPPLEPAARHYVVFESLQFALVALVLPALLVIGAPFDRVAAPEWLGRSLMSLGARPVDRQLRPRTPRVAATLGVYAGALVFWQIPFVVDRLRASPALAFIEIGAFAIVGYRYWSELVSSRSRVSGIGRVGLAVVPMWIVWALAYLIGFSRGAWFPAFGHRGGVLSTLADQQFATGTLWAVSAAVFLPVIFVNFLRCLSDDDLDGELRRLVRRGHKTSRVT